jgi:AraC-like DNA-binding protein
MQIQRWTDHAGESSDGKSPSPARIETLILRPGFQLILSDIGPGDGPTFFHEEEEDVVALGFHLKGGAAFDLQSTCVRTEAFDCWMSAAPKGARSEFRIGPQGFQTISMRLSPALASSFFGQHLKSQIDELVRGRLGETTASRGSTLNAIGVNRIQSMFNTPYTGSARSLHLESGALALLGDLLASQPLSDCEETALTAGDRQRVGRARELLESRLRDPPTIHELARAAGLNEFKLKRDFKRLFGTTVFGYVRARRLEIAQAYLQQGMPVHEAAFQVGYHCASRFAQAFRRQHGVAPGDVARSAREKNPA